MNRTIDTLFRITFNNIIIHNNIFKYIKGTGRNYEKADLSFILKNKKWELYIYKVNTGEIFKNLNLILVESLIQQFQKELKSDKLRVENTLIKFYECNKIEIFKLFNQSQNQQTTTTTTTIISPISFFIGLKCTTLVKLLFKEKYFKDGQLIGKVDNISEYYEQCIKSGNIELLSFLYGELKLPITNYKDMLYWSLQSSNRDEIVNYLSYKRNFIPKNESELVSAGESKGKFFIYLVKLDFKLFKKIVDSLSLCQYIPIHNVTVFSNYSKSTLSNEIPDGYGVSDNECFVPFKKVLDFIQCSIYIMMNKKDDNTIKYNYHFKKVQLLIQYNEIENEIQKDSIKNQILNLENENSGGDKGSKSGKSSKSSKSSSGGGGGGLFKSIFKSSNSSSSTTLPIPPPPEKIKFEEFNLEREVRRVYTFDFLRTFKELSKLPIYLNFVINFASSFKEYSCIDNLLQTYDNLSSDEKKEKEKKITSISIGIAFLNADSDLLEYIHQHNRLEFKQQQQQTGGVMTISKPTKLFSIIETPVDTQICFLYKLVRSNFNLSIPFVSVLSHVFGNDNLTIKELDLITDAIETYFKKIESTKQQIIKYLDIQIIIGNKTVLNYYLNHQDKSIKRFFSNWDMYDQFIVGK